MKHFEEHSLEEILNLSPEGYTHPAVVDGKLVRCEGTECTDCVLSCRHTTSGRLCDLNFIEWLYSEVQEDLMQIRKRRILFLFSGHWLRKKSLTRRRRMRGKMKRQTMEEYVKEMLSRKGK